MRSFGSCGLDWHIDIKPLRDVETARGQSSETSEIRSSKWHARREDNFGVYSADKVEDQACLCIEERDILLAPSNLVCLLVIQQWQGAQIAFELVGLEIDQVLHVKGRELALAPSAIVALCFDFLGTEDRCR